jgi:hypothetical protein
MFDDEPNFTSRLSDDVDGFVDRCAAFVARLFGATPQDSGRMDEIAQGDAMARHAMRNPSGANRSSRYGNDDGKPSGKRVY